MLLAIALTLFSVYLFIFFFWRKLKEDYTENQIFSTAFYALLGAGVLGIIADNFASLWSFWLSLAGGVAGFSLGILRFKMRPFEVIEAAVPGGLVLTSNYFFYNFLITKNPHSFIALVIVLILSGLFFIFDKHYKRFTWYKSGKIGFSGMLTIGIFFLIRTVVALFAPSMLSFVGRADAVISGIISFASFLILFNLAEVKT